MKNRNPRFEAFQPADLEIVPRDDGPWREAHTHLQEGRLPEAHALLLQAVDDDPGSFQGNYMLGIVLAAMKDTPGAIAAFRQAVAIDGNGVTKRTGNIALAKGKHELTIEYFANDNQGANVFSVAWSGPGFTQTSIGAGNLSH